MFRTLSSLFPESGQKSGQKSGPSQRQWFVDNENAKKEMLYQQYKNLDGLNHIQTQPQTQTQTQNPNVETGIDIGIDRILQPIDERFAVTLALTGSHNTRMIRNEDVRIYNRVANPVIPMRDNMLDFILKENTPDIVHNKNVSKETYFPLTTYDFYSDIPDTTPPPFDMLYLQHLFTKIGTPYGSIYPSNHNMVSYNSIQTIGEIKQYFNEVVESTKSNNPIIKQDAFTRLGIKQTVKRIPYIQGIEVFWFHGNTFIRRTIEKNMITVNQNLYNVVQLTDIRVKHDMAVTFDVSADEFFISVNHPSDKMLLHDKIVDKPGQFANIGKGKSKAYSKFSASLPNITKIYFEGPTFTLQNPFTHINYSLTCEQYAPFLNFEVNHGIFEEIRNPGFFSQTISSIDYHLRPEEQEFVPGKKSFVRFNNSNSHIDINMSHWGSMTACIRLKSIPVTDEILIYCGICIIAKPLNRSTVGISILHDGKITHSTSRLSVNIWYVIAINETDVYCDTIDSFINKTVGVTKIDKIAHHSVVIGRKNIPSVFSYDMAWVHFFDYMISIHEIARDCMANWMFT